MRSSLHIIAVAVVIASLPVFAADKKSTSTNTPLRTKTAAVSQCTNSAPAYPIIGYIEKRDRIIAIQSGPKGPVYTVKTTNGEVLFEKLSASELRAKAPEIHEFIKTATASKQDASLRIGLR